MIRWIDFTRSAWHYPAVVEDPALGRVALSPAVFAPARLGLSRHVVLRLLRCLLCFPGVSCLLLVSV